ncbi:F-pol [Chelonid alphaherpesvirus 5]|uniref:F-pol n=1 Tax=Chelonid alphaherpesvirus 5 TaxID=702736 RepID=V5NXH4_9ALPH|nr:F-pol [Chelonid alphaherpesvirus 5]AHA93384.1 F-pol [Chelonid alphaherpesvirus 5]
MMALVPLSASGETVLSVNDLRLPFLVDTGASVSAIRRADLPDVLPSGESMSAIGISGVPSRLQLSKPLKVGAASQVYQHAFLLSDTLPVNLLGRDLLCKLGCSIFCSPKGVYLRIPRQAEAHLLPLLKSEEPAVRPGLDPTFLHYHLRYA